MHCDNCGSLDTSGPDDDGWWYCNSCGWESPDGDPDDYE